MKNLDGSYKKEVEKVKFRISEEGFEDLVNGGDTAASLVVCGRPPPWRDGGATD